MYIDYNYALDGRYTISDREKFQLLKEVYPYQYISRNICAKYVGAGREIFPPKNKKNILFKEPKTLLPKIINLIQEKKKLSQKLKEETLLSLGFLLESPIEDAMREMAREIKLREQFSQKPKEFRSYMLKQSKELAHKELNALFIDMQIEINKDITSELTPYIEEIVKKVFNKGVQTINTWENQEGNIPNSTIKKDLANMFGMQYIMWENDYIDIQSFKNDLEILKKPKEKNFDIKSKELDNKILGEVLPIPLNEETELEFISQTIPIKIPGNLSNFSSNFIFNLANLLKSHNQASDALYVLDSLEKKVEPFVFYYRKKIQHLKAVLLSHKTIQKWDEAIVILRYLYADGYHFEKPEILTLLASNYKRKALYHPNGTLNYKEQVDINLLQQANELYEDAYNLSQDDKYYHAINRAYMMLIIDAIEGTNEKKKIQREIATMYNELLKNGFPSNKKDWWQVITQIEFLLLMQRDSEAFDVFESYNSTSSKAFDIETTIRQLELYSHFSGDGIGLDFVGVLRV